jgi:preprotein translocase subunit YajC
VIISGGEYGVIEEVKPNTVVVKIAENVKVKYGKGYVVAVRQQEED